MKKAFTLIELLVVIAIIAILAAILFPVFAQAKLAAKKSVDLSNMKQLAIGAFLYAGDYDDFLMQTSWEQSASGSPEQAAFPGTFNPANPNGTYQVHWSYLIQPYVKNYGIFVNPADKDPVKVDNPCASDSQIGVLDGSGHMTCDWAAPVNSYIPIYNAIPAHDWIPAGLGAFPYPAQQIIFTTHRNDDISANQHKGTSGFYPSQPCPAWTIVPLPAGASTSSPPAPAANTYSYFTGPAANAEVAFLPTASLALRTTLFKKYDILRAHFDLYTTGANYSFADGHAKYQTIGQTLNPNAYEYGVTWLPQSAPWNSSPCP